MKTENHSEGSPNQHPFWRLFFNGPSTSLGFWSLGLMIAFVAFLGMFYGMVAAGQRGGDTFFSNPWLASAFLMAIFSAIGAGGVSLVAFFWQRERSILGFLAFLLGFFTLWFVIAELLIPH